MSELTLEQMEAELVRRGALPGKTAPESGLPFEQVEAELRRRGALPEQQQPAQQPQQQPQTPGQRLPAPARYALEAASGATSGMVNLMNFLVPGQPVNDPSPPKGHFTGEGLATDIVSFSGELAATGVGFGGVLRATAKTASVVLSKLPIAERGTMLASLIKQMANARGVTNTSAVTADAGYGVASGVGGAVVGEAAANQFGERARAGGQLAGELLTPALAAGSINAFRGWFNSMEELTTRVAAGEAIEAGVNIDEIREGVRLFYGTLDQSNIHLNGPSVQRLEKSLSGLFNNIKGYPDNGAAMRSIKELQSLGEDVTFSHVWSHMKDLEEVMGSGGEPGRLARKVHEELGSYINTLNLQDLDVPPEVRRQVGVENFGEVWKHAKSFFQREQTHDAISTIMEHARIDAGSGPGGSTPFLAGVQNGLRGLLKDTTGQGKYLTPFQRKVIEEISKDSDYASIVRKLGGIGFNSEDFVRTAMYSGLTGTAAAVGITGSTSVGLAGLAGTGLVLGGHAIGQAFKRRADRMFSANANLQRQVLLAADDPIKITRVYMANTPASRRDPADLATLLLRGTDLGDFAESGLARQSSFVANSVYLSIAAQQMDRKETEAQGNQPYLPGYMR